MAFDDAQNSADRAPQRIDVHKSDSSQRPKVIPIRPTEKASLGHPRLDEIRQLLDESEPVAAPPLDPAPGLDPEDDLSDENVIRYRGAFRRRFGIGFDWLPHHRRALIALLHEKGLTDREVKMFRHTGNLTRTPIGVELTANRWVALWGGLQLLTFAALFGALAIAAVPNLIADPIRALRAVAVLSGIAALCCTMFWLYIKPWIVQRRAGQRQSRRAI
ncbi:MAG: hypothetical protein Q8L99_00730 [Polycyclovorans sp.]|nr:hypothetical protein [Polycyclovorans sp.]